MELKLAGDLSVTLSDMEQELRSTYQRLELLEQITGRGSLRAARYHLGKSIRALTSSSDEEVSTKTAQ